MRIPLPNGSCRAWNSSTSLYVYNGSQRTTWYLIDGEFVQGSTSTFTTIPTGTNCVTEGPQYKPELEVYYTHLAMASFIFILFIVYKALRGRNERI